MRAINGLKVCSKCGERKLVSEFSSSRSNPDGLQDWCKACDKAYYEKNRDKIRARHSSYYRENRSELLARSEAYYDENRAERQTYHKAYDASERGRQVHRQSGRRRRALKLETEGSHTDAEFNELCEALGLRCQGCYEIFSPGELTEDHIIPLSRGGNDNIGNIQPLCKSCNCSKSARTMDEWVIDFQRREPRWEDVDPEDV